MLLLIDAGNTRVKWAVAEPQAAPGKWLVRGLVEHAQINDLAHVWGVLGGLTHALVSNVAGTAMRERLEAMLLGYGMRQENISWFASQAHCAGLTNLYREPERLGCDRFATAIGARTLYPGRPLLVATCGTATTVDAISANAEFSGGMILPGLGLMAKSLARNTAQLPDIAQDIKIADPFATHTEAGIASGCLAAQAGAIEHAYAALERRGTAPVCLLSGGAASLIAPHLAVPHEIVENLVLIGLHTAATSSTESRCLN